MLFSVGDLVKRIGTDPFVHHLTGIVIRVEPVTSKKFPACKNHTIWVKWLTPYIEEEESYWAEDLTVISKAR